MVVDHRCLTWHGTGVSAGAASGPARVIRDADDLLAAASGEILVTRHGLPTMLPALLRARAAVCETGGQLSHLAILARELGKPCVTGLPGVVEAMESGAWLRVDGTRGLVEWAGAPAQVVLSGDPVDPPATAMLPVLQFGRFSAVFERDAAPFTLETAVRVAALVTLPLTLVLGPVWRFEVTETRILVEAEGIRSIKATLVRRLQAGTLAASDLGAEYRSGCAWDGWERLGHEQPPPGRLGEALHRYLRLNQLTWTAAIVKEPLTRTFADFLADRLPWLDQASRTELLLDSLTVPGQSYILQASLDHDRVPHTWSRTLDADPRLSSEPADLARVHSLAGARRGSAERRLRTLLPPDDARRALGFAADIGELATITERKNTDLHRRGAALFAGADRQRAIAALLDLELTKNETGDQTMAVAEPASAVDRIIGKLAGGQVGPSREDTTVCEGAA